jgi:hypothetical protein
MGVIRLFSGDRYPSPPATAVQVNPTIKLVVPGNPDPANYRIIDTLTVGNILIAEIQYPDCKNYEGRKILVFEGVSAQALRGQKLIDPHFSKNSQYISPIARFEPTTKGWAMATSFAKMWNAKK